jgi:hypothetical protein
MHKSRCRSIPLVEEVLGVCLLFGLLVSEICQSLALRAMYHEIRSIHPSCLTINSPKPRTERYLYQANIPKSIAREPVIQLHRDREKSFPRQTMSLVNPPLP